MNIDTDEATWIQTWKLVNNITVCNRTKEIEFRLLQISLHFRYTMDHNKSELCMTCNGEAKTHYYT